MTPLVVTPGDPRGIGPEVVGKALARWAGPVVVIGDAAALGRWVPRLVPVDAIAAVQHGVAVLDPGDRGEPVEVASLRLAVAACRAGEARAVVTGPIHKGRLAARGFRHPGHTEFLAELCGVEHVVMGFLGGRVRVSLATVHLPLRSVADALDRGAVVRAIAASDRALRAWVRGPRARIAVCGLNPHAGDGGVLGREDLEVVAPAVADAVAAGIDAVGPWSAEACFRAAVRDEVDWVVAMYHDQGLAPLKALEWAGPPEQRAVNVTLDLPILRVGVDHGTADDIAGRGIADEGSLFAALSFADRWSMPHRNISD
ncbi:MAG: 4-hydroxythreonine-4-phosphate dehydrogenase PdxA [Myxococcota bacterium]